MSFLKNERKIDDFCIWSADDDEYIVISYQGGDATLIYPPTWYEALMKITWEMKVRKAMKKEMRKKPRNDAKLIIDNII